MRIIFAFVLYLTEQNKRETIYHHTTHVSPPQFGACHSNSVLSSGCLQHGPLFCQLDWWNLWSQDKDDDWVLVNWATVLRGTKAAPTSLQLKAPDGNFRNAELWLNAAPSEISGKVLVTLPLISALSTLEHPTYSEGKAGGGDRGEDDTNGAYPLQVHATNISQTYLPLIKSLVHLFRSFKNS